MPTLHINGQPASFDSATFPQTVAALIEARGLNRKAIVAEVGGTIVAQQDFDNYPLKDNDQIELIQFVGGG